ncbi:MFS transporter [Escherichia coli]
MYQLMVTLGIVLAFLSDTAFSYSGNRTQCWGFLLYQQSCSFYDGVFLPNSPRWLAEKGRHIEAEEVCVCCAIRRKKREKNSTKFVKA